MVEIIKGLTVIGRSEMMGLGTMTEEFSTYMGAEKVIIMDRGNGRLLPIPPYNPASKVEVIGFSNWRNDAVAKNLLRGSKWVVGFESFYKDNVPEIARQISARTVLVPNWEWSPVSITNRCHYLICLSKTDHEHYKDIPATTRNLRYDWPKSPIIHDPRRVVNWPPKVFLHCAGNASHNRNGTKEVLEAARWLEGTEAVLWVTSQFPIPSNWLPTNYATLKKQGNLTIQPVSAKRKEMWDRVDCLVFPRRIGGHSLPINEATGEGIPCIL